MEVHLLDACRFINYIMIELRSYNVERIWHETAICTIGNEVGVHKEILEKNAPAIREMVSQIETDKDGNVPFMFCNHRKDGELWTPYYNHRYQIPRNIAGCQERKLCNICPEFPASIHT